MNRLLEREHLFQERSIKTWLKEMEDTFQQWCLMDKSITDPYDPGFVEQEWVDQIEDRYEYYAKRVYNLCIAYFESKHLPIYTAKFEIAVAPFFADKKKMYEAECPSYLEEVFSSLAGTFRLYLNSFQEFGSIEEDLRSLDCLENILLHTAFILKQSGKKPTNEAEVYNAVKMVCEATFPKAQHLNGFHPFYKLAKCYKPDILIPALNCAVEYKYATSEKELNDTIDQILIDVHGYGGHDVYKSFYAVFYIEAGIVPSKRSQEIWNEKNFPENWKPFFVEGH